MTTDHNNTTHTNAPQPPDTGLEDETQHNTHTNQDTQLQTAKKQREVTLERVLRNPHKIKMVEIAKQLLAEGCSKRKTVRATGLSFETVHAIAERFTDELGTLKQQAVRQCQRIQALTGDAMEEYLERHFDPNDDFNFPSNQIPISYGVFTDKAELLSGQATSRQETIKDDQPTIPLDEIYKSLQAKKAKEKAIDV
jgi:hypothetical protein